MPKIITVGVSEYKFAKTPDILLTKALGSCVGIVLYDKELSSAAMGHVMLPELESASLSARENKAKFATSCIDLLLDSLKKHGVVGQNVEAKIAGGANMFPSISDEFNNVGARNVSAAKKRLGELGIKLVSEDCGGNEGRTIFFDIATGMLRVKKIHGDEFFI